jgi:ABC-type multidrug transport system ATPase subunit
MKRVAPLITDFTLTVSFRDLSIWTMAAEEFISTVWTTIRDTFFCSAPKYRYDILKNVTGTFVAGKMTLVIGPPQSGKSSLMKLLSGRLHASKDIHIEGNVAYNGDSVDSGKFLVPKIVDYIDQNDTHEPTLTVFETFEFAFRATTGGHHSYAVARDSDAAAKLDESDRDLSKVSPPIDVGKRDDGVDH